MRALPTPRMTNTRWPWLRTFTRTVESFLSWGVRSDWREDGLRQLEEWEEELDDLLNDVHWQVPLSCELPRKDDNDP